MTLRTLDGGGRVVEVPIEFRERELGKSKMSQAIVVEAMAASRVGPQRRLATLLGRRPGPAWVVDEREAGPGRPAPPTGRGACGRRVPPRPLAGGDGCDGDEHHERPLEEHEALADGGRPRSAPARGPATRGDDRVAGGGGPAAHEREGPARRAAGRPTRPSCSEMSKKALRPSRTAGRPAPGSSRRGRSRPATADEAPAGDVVDAGQDLDARPSTQTDTAPRSEAPSRMRAAAREARTAAEDHEPPARSAAGDAGARVPRRRARRARPATTRTTTANAATGERANSTAAAATAARPRPGGGGPTGSGTRPRRSRGRAPPGSRGSCGCPTSPWIGPPSARLPWMPRNRIGWSISSPPSTSRAIEATSSMRRASPKARTTWTRSRPRAR